MTVTPQTPFRQCGGTDVDSFTAAICRTATGVGRSPMCREAADVYNAIPGFTRLAAAMAWEETKNFTLTSIPVGAKNPWAVSAGMANGQHTWYQYDTFADAARDWVRHVTNPAVFPQDWTVQQLINKYAPSSDGNDPTAYAQIICDQMNRLPQAGPVGPTGPTGPTSPTGPVGPVFPFSPWPSGFVTKIATKPKGSSGQGWDAVTPKRGDRLTHIVVHHTAGGPGFTKDSCWQLFSIGGQRVLQALTEAVMDRDGTGYLLNDPWSDDPLSGSGRSPWASGPATALSSVGAAYVRQYGANAVNDLGFAMEHCNAAGEKWQDAIIAEGAKVYAVALTRRKHSWEDFPLMTPGGLWSAFHHDDFAPTECPAITSGTWAAYKDAIRTEMKTLQAGGVSPPGPGPEPPPTPPPDQQRYTHFGLTLEEVTALFGTMHRYNKDGTIDALPFNPLGPLSLVWLDRCDKEGIFPTAGRLDVTNATFTSGDAQLATWSSGWTAYLPLDNARAGWRWIDAPSSTFIFGG